MTKITDPREILRQEIASILDHPSVYMGGPSPGSLRRAERVLEHLERTDQLRLNQPESPKIKCDLDKLILDLKEHRFHSWAEAMEIAAEELQKLQTLVETLRGEKMRLLDELELWKRRPDVGCDGKCADADCFCGFRAWQHEMEQPRGGEK